MTAFMSQRTLVAEIHEKPGYERFSVSVNFGSCTSFELTGTLDHITLHYDSFFRSVL